MPGSGYAGNDPRDSGTRAGDARSKVSGTAGPPGSGQPNAQAVYFGAQCSQAGSSAVTVSTGPW